MNPHDEATKMVPARGFIALWEVLRRTRVIRTFSRFTDAGGAVLAAGMSFQALFAVFAALWVGFGVFAVSTRQNDELLTTIAGLINFYVPGLIETSNSKGAISLTDLVNNRVFDWTSIVAGASLLWVAMSWFTSTRRSIRLIFGLEVKEYRNFILLKIRDLTGAVVLCLAILFSAVLTIVGSGVFHRILDALGLDTNTWLIGTLGTLSSYGLTLIVDTLIVAGIHTYLAEVRVPRLMLLRSAFLGAVVFLVLKVFAGLLLGGATTNTLLLPFAVIVGLLIWFNLLCRALLLTSSWLATGYDPQLGLPGPESEA